METIAADVVMLGDSGVGKSSIVIRFVRDEFPVTPEMIRYEFFMRTVAENNFRVKYRISDTAGQERFGALTPRYVRNADCLPIVYDITDKEKWLEFIEKGCMKEPTVMALVGNELDLEAERKVSVEEASLFAEKHSFLFMEVSAKTAANINALFSEIAKKLVSHPPPPPRDVGNVKLVVGEQGTIKFVRIEKQAESAQAQSPPCRHSLG